MFEYAATVVLGTIYAQLLEFLLHKYVLHGKRLGKKKNNFFSFHWKEHHKKSRKNGFYDEDYEGPRTWNAAGKEVASLAFLTLLHTPVLLFSPLLFSSLVSSAATYYTIHRYSHLNPEWSKKWLPWHYDHHQGVDQDKNWGVTTPLFDHVFGTRVRYEYEDTGKVRKVRKS